MSGCIENAQECLRIQSVNLRKSNIEVRNEIDITLLDRKETLEQSFRTVTNVTGAHVTDSDKNEYYIYRFGYMVGIRLILTNELPQSKDPEYRPIVEIMANFEAKYFSERRLADEDLKTFSTSNVGYHVWPFWREYAQSTCARLGLSPAFEIPFYFVQKKKKRIKKYPTDTNT